MTCEPADARTLAAQIESANSGRTYAAGPETTGTAYFTIALPRPVSAAALFLIRSNRTDDWLYRGPFLPEVAVPFDRRLSADNGSDTLSLHLLDTRAGLTCSWLNERSERYWRDGARIAIRLLEEGDFGPDQLFRQFEVTFR
jgi:hypothetical protein